MNKVKTFLYWSYSNPKLYPHGELLCKVEGVDCILAADAICKARTGFDPVKCPHIGCQILNIEKK